MGCQCFGASRARWNQVTGVPIWIRGVGKDCDAGARCPPDIDAVDAHTGEIAPRVAAAAYNLEVLVTDRSGQLPRLSISFMPPLNRALMGGTVTAASVMALLSDCESP